MIDIPPNYFESKFFEHVGHVQKKSNGDMVGCCPFCGEGSSWGKKRRFNYYSDSMSCKCFNCGVYYDALNFLKNIENKSFSDLLKDIKQNGGEFTNSNYTWVNNDFDTIKEPPDIQLPPDAINLMDKRQTNFYSNDYYVNLALETIRKRRLDVAKYNSDLFLSRTDYLHKNRIIIPFLDEFGEVIFYQSRAQNSKQMEMGKYISSLNGRKVFYGLNKINNNKENVFILEGPLDCFFLENSISGGGIEFNSKQKSVIEELEILYNIVYCLDNDFNNKEVLKKYYKYIKSGKNVFMWGGKFSKYKDFNEYCIGEKVNSINENEILKQTYNGIEASKIIVSKIRSNR